MLSWGPKQSLVKWIIGEPNALRRNRNWGIWSISISVLFRAGLSLKQAKLDATSLPRQNSTQFLEENVSSPSTRLEILVTVEKACKGWGGRIQFCVVLTSTTLSSQLLEPAFRNPRKALTDFLLWAKRPSFFHLYSHESEPRRCEATK